MKCDRFIGSVRLRAALPLFPRAGLAVVLVVSLIPGCGPGDGGDQPSPGEAWAPSGTVAGESAPRVGTGSGERTPGSISVSQPGPVTGAQGPRDSALFTPPAAPTQVTPPGDSAPSTPPQDSILAVSIEARLELLEAQKDSLRATVGTLLGFLLAAPEDRNPPPPEGIDQAPPADSAGVAGEILAVDARQVQNWGFRIVVAVLFLLVTGLFIRLVIWVLDRLAEQNAKRRLFFKRLVPVARISLWFLAILFASMVILRIEARGLIAAGAAVGVAVGFAAQDILKNIFGGLIVLFDQPFQVGDKISVAGTYGEVVSIGLRSTRIVTPDDNLVSVPNAQVVDSQVANANAGELNCQVVTDLYLPGWVDEAKAKRIAFEAATSSKYVFLNKPVVVLVKDEFKETFLTHLKVKAYVLDPRYEFLFMSDVTERARVGFRKAGLLGPMHGARAYIDLDRFPETTLPSGGEEAEE